MRDHFRPRLILLLLFVAGVPSVLYYPYDSSYHSAPLLVGVSFLCLPFLVAMEGFYVVSGRVRKRELPLVFAFRNRRNGCIGIHYYNSYVSQTLCCRGLGKRLPL